MQTTLRSTAQCLYHHTPPTPSSMGSALLAQRPWGELREPQDGCDVLRLSLQNIILVSAEEAIWGKWGSSQGGGG